MYESWRELIPIENYDDDWVYKHDEFIDNIKKMHQSDL
jgi:hypothetical protein